MDYDGPQIEFVLRDPKTADSSALLKQSFAHLGGKVATFSKDHVSPGSLAEEVEKALPEQKDLVDFRDFLELVEMKKIESEVENMGVAGRFVSWTLKETINEIENIIDVEKPVKHENI